MNDDRNFFPGSNSAQGFFDRFDQILPSDNKRAYLLKGGPGVGKSNFMRKTAQWLNEKGLSIEYFHCSSDPESLDAIAAKEIGLMMADATAPHTLDPKLPGAVDGIINLGAYLNAKALSAKRDDIAQLTDNIKHCFARTYHYLAAAARLRADSEQTMLRAIDLPALKQLTDQLCDAVFGDKKVSEVSSNGAERKLFIDAITPIGVISYNVPSNRVLALEAPWGFKMNILLAPIRDMALERGYYVESYYDPLEPLDIAHLSIPELSVAVTSSQATNKNAEVFSVSTVLNADVLASDGANLRWNRHMYENLETKAVECLAKEKALHDKLEGYYTTNMDFCAWQNEFEKTLNEISQLCQI